MNIWKKVTIAVSVVALVVATGLAWSAGPTVAEASGAHCNGVPNCRDLPRWAGSGCVGSECYSTHDICCLPEDPDHDPN